VAFVKMTMNFTDGSETGVDLVQDPETGEWISSAELEMRIAVREEERKKRFAAAPPPPTETAFVDQSGNVSPVQPKAQPAVQTRPVQPMPVQQQQPITEQYLTPATDPNDYWETFEETPAPESTVLDPGVLPPDPSEDVGVLPPDNDPGVLPPETGMDSLVEQALREGDSRFQARNLASPYAGLEAFNEFGTPSQVSVQDVFGVPESAADGEQMREFLSGLSPHQLDQWHNRGRSAESQMIAGRLWERFLLDKEAARTDLSLEEVLMPGPDIEAKELEQAAQERESLQIMSDGIAQGFFYDGVKDVARRVPPDRVILAPGLGVPIYVRGDDDASDLEALNKQIGSGLSRIGQDQLTTVLQSIDEEEQQIQLARQTFLDQLTLDTGQAWQVQTSQGVETLGSDKLAFLKVAPSLLPRENLTEGQAMLRDYLVSLVDRESFIRQQREQIQQFQTDQTAREEGFRQASQNLFDGSTREDQLAAFAQEIRLGLRTEFNVKDISEAVKVTPGVVDLARAERGDYLLTRAVQGLRGDPGSSGLQLIKAAVEQTYGIDSAIGDALLQPPQTSPDESMILATDPAVTALAARTLLTDRQMQAALEAAANVERDQLVEEFLQQFPEERSKSPEQIMGALAYFATNPDDQDDVEGIRRELQEEEAKGGSWLLGEERVPALQGRLAEAELREKAALFLEGTEIPEYLRHQGGQNMAEWLLGQAGRTIAATADFFKPVVESRIAGLAGRSLIIANPFIRLGAAHGEEVLDALQWTGEATNAMVSSLFMIVGGTVIEGDNRARTAAGALDLAMDAAGNLPVVGGLFPGSELQVSRLPQAKNELFASARDRSLTDLFNIQRTAGTTILYHSLRNDDQWGKMQQALQQGMGPEQFEKTFANPWLEFLGQAASSMFLDPIVIGWRAAAIGTDALQIGRRVSIGERIRLIEPEARPALKATANDLYRFGEINRKYAPALSEVAKVHPELRGNPWGLMEELRRDPSSYLEKPNVANWMRRWVFDVPFTDRPAATVTKLSDRDMYDFIRLSGQFQGRGELDDAARTVAALATDFHTGKGGRLFGRIAAQEALARRLPVQPEAFRPLPEAMQDSRFYLDGRRSAASVRLQSARLADEATARVDTLLTQARVSTDPMRRWLSSSQLPGLVDEAQQLTNDIFRAKVLTGQAASDAIQKWGVDYGILPNSSSPVTPHLIETLQAFGHAKGGPDGAWDETMRLLSEGQFRSKAEVLGVLNDGIARGLVERADAAGLRIPFTHFNLPNPLHAPDAFGRTVNLRLADGGSQEVRRILQEWNKKGQTKDLLESATDARIKELSRRAGIADYKSADRNKLLSSLNGRRNFNRWHPVVERRDVYNRGEAGKWGRKLSYDQLTFPERVQNIVSSALSFGFLSTPRFFIRNALNNTFTMALDGWATRVPGGPQAADFGISPLMTATGTSGITGVRVRTGIDRLRELNGLDWYGQSQVTGQVPAYIRRPAQFLFHPASLSGEIEEGGHRAIQSRAFPKAMAVLNREAVQTFWNEADKAGLQVTGSMRKLVDDVLRSQNPQSLGRFISDLQAGKINQVLTNEGLSEASAALLSPASKQAYDEALQKASVAEVRKEVNRTIRTLTDGIQKQMKDAGFADSSEAVESLRVAYEDAVYQKVSRGIPHEVAGRQVQRDLAEVLNLSSADSDALKTLQTWTDMAARPDAAFGWITSRQIAGDLADAFRETKTGLYDALANIMRSHVGDGYEEQIARVMDRLVAVKDEDASRPLMQSILMREFHGVNVSPQAITDNVPPHLNINGRAVPVQRIPGLPVQHPPVVHLNGDTHLQIAGRNEDIIKKMTPDNQAKWTSGQNDLDLEDPAARELLKRRALLSLPAAAPLGVLAAEEDGHTDLGPIPEEALLALSGIAMVGSLKDTDAIKVFIHQLKEYGTAGAKTRFLSAAKDSRLLPKAMAGLITGREFFEGMRRLDVDDTINDALDLILTQMPKEPNTWKLAGQPIDRPLKPSMTTDGRGNEVFLTSGDAALALVNAGFKAADLAPLGTAAKAWTRMGQTLSRSDLDDLPEGLVKLLSDVPFNVIQPDGSVDMPKALTLTQAMGDHLLRFEGNSNDRRLALLSGLARGEFKLESLSSRQVKYLDMIGARNSDGTLNQKQLDFTRRTLQAVVNTRSGPPKAKSPLGTGAQNLQKQLHIAGRSGVTDTQKALKESPEMRQIVDSVLASQVSDEVVRLESIGVEQFEALGSFAPRLKQAPSEAGQGNTPFTSLSEFSALGPPNFQGGFRPFQFPPDSNMRNAPVHYSARPMRRPDSRMADPLTTQQGGKTLGLDLRDPVGEPLLAPSYESMLDDIVQSVTADMDVSVVRSVNQVIGELLDEAWEKKVQLESMGDRADIQAVNAAQDWVNEYRASKGFAPVDTSGIKKANGDDDNWGRMYALQRATLEADPKTANLYPGRKSARGQAHLRIIESGRFPELLKIWGPGGFAQQLSEKSGLYIDKEAAFREGKAVQRAWNQIVRNQARETPDIVPGEDRELFETLLDYVDAKDALSMHKRDSAGYRDAYKTYAELRDTLDAITGRNFRPDVTAMFEGGFWRPDAGPVNLTPPSDTRPESLNRWAADTVKNASVLPEAARLEVASQVWGYVKEIADEEAYQQTLRLYADFPTGERPTNSLIEGYRRTMANADMALQGIRQQTGPRYYAGNQAIGVLTEAERKPVPMSDLQQAVVRESGGKQHSETDWKLVLPAPQAKDHATVMALLNAVVGDQANWRFGSFPFGRGVQINVQDADQLASFMGKLDATIQKEGMGFLDLNIYAGTEEVGRQARDLGDDLGTFLDDDPADSAQAGIRSVSSGALYREQFHLADAPVPVWTAPIDTWPPEAKDYVSPVHLWVTGDSPLPLGTAKLPDQSVIEQPMAATPGFEAENTMDWFFRQVEDRSGLTELMNRPIQQTPSPGRVPVKPSVEPPQPFRTERTITGGTPGQGQLRDIPIPSSQRVLTDTRVESRWLSSQKAAIERSSKTQDQVAEELQEQWTRIYHGSSQAGSITHFSPEHTPGYTWLGRENQLTFFSDNPEVTSQYAGPSNIDVDVLGNAPEQAGVFPAEVSSNLRLFDLDPYIANVKAGDFDQRTAQIEPLVRQARQDGYDGVSYNGEMIDSGQPGRTYGIFPESLEKVRGAYDQQPLTQAQVPAASALQDPDIAQRNTAHFGKVQAELAQSAQERAFNEQSLDLMSDQALRDFMEWTNGKTYREITETLNYLNGSLPDDVTETIRDLAVDPGEVAALQYTADLHAVLKASLDVLQQKQPNEMKGIIPLVMPRAHTPFNLADIGMGTGERAFRPSGQQALANKQMLTDLGEGEVITDMFRNEWVRTADGLQNLREPSSVLRLDDPNTVSRFGPLPELTTIRGRGVVPSSAGTLEDSSTLANVDVPIRPEISGSTDTSGVPNPPVMPTNPDVLTQNPEALADGNVAQRHAMIQEAYRQAGVKLPPSLIQLAQGATPWMGNFSHPSGPGTRIAEVLGDIHHGGMLQRKLRSATDEVPFREDELNIRGRPTGSGDKQPPAIDVLTKLLSDHNSRTVSNAELASAISKRMSDYTLHNYANRNDLDTLLRTFIPWHFWTTRSVLKYGQRLAEQPWAFGGVARTFGLLDSLSGADGQDLPDQTKDRLKSALAPMMPGWAEGALGKVFPGLQGAAIGSDIKRMFFPMDMLGFGESPLTRGQGRQDDLYSQPRENLTGFGQMITGIQQLTGAFTPLINYTIQDQWRGLLYTESYREYLGQRNRDTVSLPPVYQTWNRTVLGFVRGQVGGIGPINLTQTSARDFKTAEWTLYRWMAEGKFGEGQEGARVAALEMQKLQQAWNEQSLWGGRLGIFGKVEVDGWADRALQEAQRTNFTLPDGLGALTGVPLTAVLPGEIMQQRLGQKLGNDDMNRLIFDQYGSKAGDFFRYQWDQIVVDLDDEGKPITRKLAPNQLFDLIQQQAVRDVQADPAKAETVASDVERARTALESPSTLDDDEWSRLLTGYAVGDKDKTGLLQRFATDDYFREMDAERTRLLSNPLSTLNAPFGQDAVSRSRTINDWTNQRSQVEAEVRQKVFDRWGVHAQVPEGVDTLEGYYTTLIREGTKADLFRDQDGIHNWDSRSSVKESMLSLVPAAIRPRVQEMLAGEQSVEEATRDAIADLFGPVRQARKDILLMPPGKARDDAEKAIMNALSVSEDDVYAKVLEDHPEWDKAFVQYHLTNREALSPEEEQYVIQQLREGKEESVGIKELPRALKDLYEAYDNEEDAKLLSGQTDRLRLFNGVVVDSGKSWIDINGQEHHPERNVEEYLEAKATRDRVRELDGDQYQSTRYTDPAMIGYEKYFGAGPVAAEILAQIQELQPAIDEGFKIGAERSAVYERNASLIAANQQIAAYNDSVRGQRNPDGSYVPFKEFYSKAKGDFEEQPLYPAGFTELRHKYDMLKEMYDAVRYPSEYLSVVLREGGQARGLDPNVLPGPQINANPNGLVFGQQDPSLAHRAAMASMGETVGKEWRSNIGPVYEKNANGEEVPTGDWALTALRAEAYPEVGTPYVSEISSKGPATRPASTQRAETGSRTSYTRNTYTRSYSPGQARNPDSAIRGLLVTNREGEFLDNWGAVAGYVSQIYGGKVPDNIQARLAEGQAAWKATEGISDPEVRRLKQKDILRQVAGQSSGMESSQVAGQPSASDYPRGRYIVTDANGTEKAIPFRMNNDPGEAIKGLLATAKQSDLLDNWHAVEDYVTSLYGFYLPDEMAKDEGTRGMRDSRFRETWPDIAAILDLAKLSWPTTGDQPLRHAFQRQALRTLVDHLRLKEGKNALSDEKAPNTGPFVDPDPASLPARLSHSFIQRNPDFKAVRDAVTAALGYPNLANTKKNSSLPLADRQFLSAETWNRFKAAEPDLAKLLQAAEEIYPNNREGIALDLINQILARIGSEPLTSLYGTPYTSNRVTYLNSQGGYRTGTVPLNGQELMEDAGRRRVSLAIQKAWDINRIQPIEDRTLLPRTAGWHDGGRGKKKGFTPFSDDLFSLYASNN